MAHETPNNPPINPGDGSAPGATLAPSNGGVGTPALAMAAIGTATSIPTSYLFNPLSEPSRTEVFFEGLLAKDELAVWMGHEKDRKTTVALNLAICGALGRDFLGFRFAARAPLRIVMFDYESKDDSIHRRYRAISDAMELSEGLRERLRENLKIVELRRVIHDGIVIPKIDSREGQEFWHKAAAQDYPADLYIIDPMRCFHGVQENDSNIEKILAGIRRTFQRTVILPHHMVKRSQKPDEAVKLKPGTMRLWSEGCRGSGAIKAHADTIICQERTVRDDDTEIVQFGAFSKDAGDVDPMPLEESAPETFLWVPHTDLSEVLQTSIGVLRSSGRRAWPSKSDAAEILINHGITRPTAFRHIKNLIHAKRLRVENAEVVLVG